MDLSTPGMSWRSAEAAPALRFLFSLLLDDLKRPSSRVTAASAWQAWCGLVRVDVSSLHQNLRK